MRISELIAHLQSIQAEHGDLECDAITQNGREQLTFPAIAYRKILKGREWRSGFWWPSDGESRKGDKVVWF